VILHGKRFAFLSPPFVGLGATHDVHLRLIGKHVVDFLLLLIELFLLGVTAKVLRAKTDWKLVFSKGVGQYLPNFCVEGDVPSIIYTRTDMQMNVLQLYHW